MFKKVISVCASAILVLSGVGMASAQEKDIPREGIFGNKYGSGEPWCVPVPPNPGEDWYRSIIWDQQVTGITGFCNPQLEYLDRGTWGRSVVISGADTAGRQAQFRFYELAPRYSWAFGSASRIEEDGRNADFGQLLATSGFLNQVCSTQYVLGVGAASYEGDADQNLVLAGARADVIARQMTAVSEKCEGAKPEAYTINLGPHNRTNDTNTAHQRKVVLIAVETSDADVNLKEALQNGMAQNAIIEGFDVKNYNQFVMSKYPG